jgi:hypothetical protein
VGVPWAGKEDLLGVVLVEIQVQDARHVPARLMLIGQRAWRQMSRKAPSQVWKGW